MGKEKSKETLTVEALRFYVPLFQLGDNALTELYSTDLTAAEKNYFETVAALRELSTNKIVDLAKPLLYHEVNKILSTSHLKASDENLFDTIFYAGVNGIIKGLKKFEVNKIVKSSTNYILQWFNVYAKRELLVHEAAPFNIPPSRFAIYKKISAVRKRMSDLFEKEPTDEEIYEYFQTGKAEVKSMNGPLNKPKNNVSKSNKRITLELIGEQKRYEFQMHNVYSLNSSEDFDFLINTSDFLFVDSLFSVFLEFYNFTKPAQLVLKSILNVISQNEVDDLKNIKQVEYNRIEKAWTSLLKDINGPFYKFLKQINSEGFSSFDIVKTVENIESFNKVINKNEYLILFEGENIEKH